MVLATVAAGCKAADELSCRVERGGNYDACMYRVNQAHEEDRRHDDVDAPACERGDQVSCLRAAQYEMARAYGFDYDRKFRRACDANVAEACFEAGRRMLTPATRPQGIQLIYRSCEMGFQSACVDGPGMATYGPERDRFLKLACLRGVRAACNAEPSSGDHR
jgi:hypothetical protein